MKITPEMLKEAAEFLDVCAVAASHLCSSGDSQSRTIGMRLQEHLNRVRAAGKPQGGDGKPWKVCPKCYGVWGPSDRPPGSNYHFRPVYCDGTAISLHALPEDGEEVTG